MRKRGLVIASEAKDATVWCTRAGCAFRHRWLGQGAETVAIEHAKQHAETTGHRVRAEYARAVEYDTVASARDHRLPPAPLTAVRPA